jgi:DUF4097 and DUF4098 domain-containing protein YvlB
MSWRHGSFAGGTAAVLLAVCLAWFSPPAADPDEPGFINSRHPSEEVFSGNFDVSAGGALEVEVDDMDVYIKESSDGRSHVEVYVTGPNLDRSREYFQEELYFDAKARNNTLIVESEDPKYHGGDFWRRYRNVQIYVIISVPARLDAEIFTDDGDLRIDRLDGDIRIKTEDGDVEVITLSGSIDIDSSDGDIVLGELDAQEIFIETSDGDLRASKLKAGRVGMKTSDGDIEIERVDAEQIKIESSDGDIELGVSGGELRARCSDGSISVNMFSEMAVDLTARDGDIRIEIPKSVRAELNLRGEDVSLRGGAKINGRVSDRSIVGSLNDGGPLVRAKTDDGSIALAIR